MLKVNAVRAVTALSLCRNRPGGPCPPDGTEAHHTGGSHGTGHSPAAPRSRPSQPVQGRPRDALRRAGGIVALAATLVIVANVMMTTVSAQPNAHQQQILPPGTRFDGGLDEGTRGIQAAPPAELAPGTRFDGGPTTRARAARSPTGSRPTRARATSPRLTRASRPAPAASRCCRAALDRAAVERPQHPGARP